MVSPIYVSNKKLVGIQATGPSSFNKEENSGAKFGEELWRQLINLLAQSDISLDRDMFGVSWPADSQVPPQSIHYFCGFESDQELAGFSQLEIEGGNYIEFMAEVLAVDIDSAFQEAYMKALPASGLIGREGQHLEIYGADYDPNSPVAKFKILIPVE